MNYLRQLQITDAFGTQVYDIAYTEDGPSLVLKSDSAPEFIIQDRIDEIGRELIETFKECLAEKKA